MSLTPLTRDQQSAVDMLVRTRRIESVPADPRRCQQFLRQAGEALVDVGNVTRTQNRYNLAYDAAHDVGEAMLAAYGYRTRRGPGQHDALGRFLAAILDTPPESAAARHYDQMRQERNQQRYDARPITAAAATAAVQSATALHALGTQRA